MDDDLLDANVLIALVVAEHVHHEPARRWLSSGRRRFATCPVTQGSLVRFLVREGAAGSEASAVVSTIRRHRRHRFWTDDVGYDEVDLAPVAGHRQVTDAYLAGLARIRGGRLATFDAGLAAVHPDVAVLVDT
ncbi:MAG: TA system VapC family ribonuclease toxin [Acidimicrobiales bacterium]